MAYTAISSRPTPTAREEELVTITLKNRSWMKGVVPRGSGQFGQPDLVHAVHHDGDRQAGHPQDDRAPAIALDERPKPGQWQQDDGRDQVEIELEQAPGGVVSE